MRLACRARERFPWCRDLPEEEFLLHVLPHRGSDEPFQRWRRRFYDALAEAALRLEKPEEVALFVNRLAAAIFRYRGDTGWEDEGALTLLSTHEGRCEDMVNLVLAMLRAVGLPASHVYTPAWAKGDGNHAWCGVALGEEFLSFMGCEPRAEPPFFRCYMDEIVAAKVYFRSPFATLDVTSRFGRSCELAVAVGRDHAEREVHLDVLNSGGWRTVGGGRVDGEGVARFGPVGCREAILLLVSQNAAGFDASGVRAACDPFVLSPDGTVRPLAGRGEPVEATLAPGRLAPGREYAIAAWTDSRWTIAGRFRSDGEGGALLSLVPDRVHQVLDGDRPAARPFVLEGGSIVFY
ncbi:MAG: transglutaminase domain-containing protein [Planctomycetes bacterium]|nr:transglutaminase domain-containing protein [Planctomycetota bacterium]